MMITEFLDKLPSWGIFFVSLLLTFISIQFGIHLGKRKRERSTEQNSAKAGAVVTATLSLLAFMMAIVFSVVEARYNELKHVVLDEANAIGTTFLRADLMPETDRAAIRERLSEYVSLRLDAAQNADTKLSEQATESIEKLQADMWSRAMNVAAEQPTPTTALFVQSLNELIDLHEKRITLTFHYRLPGTVWLMLYGLAAIGLAMAGYESGFSSRQRAMAVTFFTAAAFSLVIMLVITLDRPHHQLSTSLRAPMIDLQQSIEKSLQSQR